MNAHVRFTADSTANLRNLDEGTRQGECFAIQYAPQPVKNEETGSTCSSLRFPLLIVTDYYDQQRDIAERVAHILNKHWDDEVAA